MRWRGEDTETRVGSLNDVRGMIPTFSRRPFAVLRGNRSEEAVNHSRDLIVRTKDDVPVGVVSKHYRLIQHVEVFDLAVEALKRAGVALTEVTCDLTLTRYAERMLLRLQLSDEYGLDPGDDNPMGLRLQCFNSVDGSTRFMAVLGWFRFVCSNGLIVGNVGF